MIMTTTTTTTMMMMMMNSLITQRFLTRLRSQQRYHDVNSLCHLSAM